MDAAIIQQVASLVRNGTIQSYEPVDWSSANFVLVGHSYGSIAGAYLTFNYPFTFDGYIFTGLAVPSGSFLPGLEMDDLHSANQVDPSHFGSLDPGYFLIPNKTARRDMFYGSPGDYSPALYDIDWSLQQTITWGELFSGGLYLSDNATQLIAPVLAIIGAEDAVLCSQYGTSALGMANCEDTPEGQVAQLASIFPNAPYSYLVQDRAGHCLQLHYTAPTGFAATKTWMQQYGF
jgi:pimeloyl-ACP methyl ester carboxylesterase